MKCVNSHFSLAQGGGILGTHLLGWTPVGYVEWDVYCQRVLAARIADGLIPCAPIFGDVREFVQSGAAEQYRGFADVVSAGFPCQPFSIAGERLAANDERNMWPATRDCICAVRPDHVLLENVTGLLTCGYAGVVFADLAAMGYVGCYGVLSAADAIWSDGDPCIDHERERLWICGTRADATRVFEGRPQQRPERKRAGALGESAPSANSARTRLEGHWDGSAEQAVRSGQGFARSTDSARGAWWKFEPELGRVADGMANRVDRLKTLGNGQVPRVVAAAWELLSA